LSHDGEAIPSVNPEAPNTDRSPDAYEFPDREDLGVLVENYKTVFALQQALIPEPAQSAALPHTLALAR
jgi:hypothetical protein